MGKKQYAECVFGTAVGGSVLIIAQHRDTSVLLDYERRLIKLLGQKLDAMQVAHECFSLLSLRREENRAQKKSDRALEKLKALCQACDMCVVVDGYNAIGLSFSAIVQVVLADRPMVIVVEDKKKARLVVGMLALSRPDEISMCTFGDTSVVDRIMKKLAYAVQRRKQWN